MFSPDVFWQTTMVFLTDLVSKTSAQVWRTLAALLGIPFYFNTEASLPLVRGLMEAGMSQGAALAFLVTGSGTSIGAIAGALTIARLRVVGLVIALLFGGAILTGFAYNLLATTGV